ncbi:hypothetical protein Tco_0978444 [Tanacetum coccineum]|uniref:Uncharacterized protein n=1 Tax=Tanacetum coccineum TaxID=301880 RepID=A0ABQ5EP32_9ASTR
MWARRCRPGMSPGKESHSSFSVPLIPGDMSPGKRIPRDKSPGIPRICRWEYGKCCSDTYGTQFLSPFDHALALDANSMITPHCASDDGIWNDIKLSI